MGKQSENIREQNTGSNVNITFVDDWREDEDYTDVIIKLRHDWLKDAGLDMLGNVETYPVGKNTDSPVYHTDSPHADFSRGEFVLTGDAASVIIQITGSEIRIEPVLYGADSIEHISATTFARDNMAEIEYRVNHSDPLKTAMSSKLKYLLGTS